MKGLEFKISGLMLDEEARRRMSGIITDAVKKSREPAAAATSAVARKTEPIIVKVEAHAVNKQVVASIIEAELASQYPRNDAQVNITDNGLQITLDATNFRLDRREGIIKNIEKIAKQAANTARLRHPKKS